MGIGAGSRIGRIRIVSVAMEGATRWPTPQVEVLGTASRVGARRFVACEPHSPRMRLTNWLARTSSRPSGGLAVRAGSVEVFAPALGGTVTASRAP